MSGGVYFDGCLRAVTWHARRAAVWLAVTFVCVCAPRVRAQQSAIAVGNIQGMDVSVAAPGLVANAAGQNGGSTVVTNGGVVTVHSGQARLMLTAGGEIDACGPAKFTLLQSGDAITVAVDFGSLRVQLPASTNLRIFTPTTIATPLDINGTPRDVTVGLELDDSLCVKAESGALLLENQFTSEKLVVPQAGQFFLAQGKLAPIARPDGKCECAMNDARLIPSSPSVPLAGLAPAPAHSEEAPAAAKTVAPPPEPEEEAAKPNIEFSTLGHANEAHPVAPQPKRETPAPPPDSTATYKIVMPPLTFSASSGASSPERPPDTTADMVLLIRTVEVEPAWEFKGHIDAPPLDDAPKQQNVHAHSHARQPRPAGEHTGFWAKVKRFFSSSTS